MQTPTLLSALCREALQRDPTQPAVEFEGHQFRWADMRRLAERLTQLVADAGAGARPPVALVARNRPSTLAAFLALVSMGCTVRMVYPFQSAAAIARDLERMDPAVVVASREDFAEPIFAMLRERRGAAVALTEMAAEAVPGFAQAAARPELEGEPQVILLTSGTTGPPKQFPLTYETVARYLAGNIAMSPGGKVDTEVPALLYFPVSNISGLYATLPPLLRGMPIVLLDRFKLDLWLDYIRRYRPKVNGLPPAVFKTLLDADVPAADLASLEYLGAGAAPLDPAVQRAFEQKYGIPILQSYGATEFAGPVCAMTPDLRREWGEAKTGSVGRPLPGMQLRIVDAATGAELPAGQDGVVEVVSCRIGPDWIRTSDLGMIDADGFLWLRGRADGAIMRGGFKLLPAVIEAALLQHPAVKEAAVVAVKDERLGQVPGAAVALKSDAAPTDAAALEAHLRGLLPATHIPVYWKFLAELPRTVSMKVEMAAVRELFAG